MCNSKVINGRDYLQLKGRASLPPQRVAIKCETDLGCHEALRLEAAARNPNTTICSENCSGTFIGRQPVEG